ncbi:pitrilysin [Otariodibacter oris]|uniref:Protease 3 n=2 Tax=Otariodibacter oris TaxID=1032623 RepID=A0A420XGU5_9PAST|nr:pitrilysin [Otariodibacter oris]QGM80056.1 pitrilysin [Otariodibacter oris]RKR71881.1 protease-3 [Otariodibacter oris]
MHKFFGYSLSATLVLSVISSTFVYAEETNSVKTTETQTIKQNSGFSVIQTEIKKSPTDNAIYQGIKLDNGMDVLLISDEKANKSLMSVGIGIGSMEDPVKQQGLAHYLEHMILMGSKKFPETNSLDIFLNKNGGYNNAYTASDRTIFYLEVNNNAFDEAVDRFADTFAEPLLSENNAKKEINAVNAEMVRAKSNDGFLIHDVNLATANPNHPITKFAVGNKETLSDKERSKLQDELVSFYQRNYSSNLMKAVLYSNQPIEKLAQLASEHLGKVKNKHLPAPQMDMPFFRDQDKSILVQYKPVRPQKMLIMSFDMPEDKAEFKHKTGEYLSYVLGNNTEGTLSDYLIKQGLSDSGVQTDSSADVSRNRGDFSFYIELTDKGLAEKDKVISLVFQQIEKIKKDGIQQSYFGEVKESLKQAFEHLQVEKSGQYVARLTSQMLSYPLADIIDQAYVAEDMDVKAVQDKLDLMTVDNVRIMVIDDKATTDKKTRYFEAPYAVSKISDAQKQQWLDFSDNPQLQLPELNPYFATDFSVNKDVESREIPKAIERSQGEVIYAMPSQYFANEPKAIMSMAFDISPEIDDLKQSMSAVLLGYMNDLSQNKLDFQASVAGMSASVSTSENGLNISASGYTQHLAKLVSDTLQQFSQFDLTEDNLRQAKQRYIESLDGLDAQSALNQAVRSLRSFANYPYFEVDKQRATIETITLQDIAQLREKLLTKTTGISALSVGNLSDDQVKGIINSAEEVIKNDHSKLDLGRYLDINQSTRKLSYIKTIPHEDNALSIAYFPKGYEELDGLSRSLLLKNIISRWYFDDLRTDKQLGYVVQATNTRIGKTSGLQFLVQTPTVSTANVMEHNQRFFGDTLAKLKAMSDEEFEKYRSSLLEVLQFKPESLSQEFSQFVSDFARDNEKFDRKDQVIELVKKMTKPNIVDFYQDAVIDQTGLVFASQAIGKNENINQPAKFDGFDKVTDIEALQKEFEIKFY